MTTARKSQVSLNDTPYYHCVSRCVRRAFLMGDDFITGKNYDHRKQWIEERIKELSSQFAITVCAYAVLSNHTHQVLYIDKEQAQNWSVDEVIERWYTLFKGHVMVERYRSGASMSEAERQVVSDIVESWRARLMDISRYMRCLNEYIARKANQEDNCKGRFWEGRFKSQALLDDTALLSCMVYVDLNPIRAGMSETLEDSDFTSIQERLKVFAKNQTRKKITANKKHLSSDTERLVQIVRHNNRDIDKIPQPETLAAFIGHECLANDDKKGIPFSPLDYFELVDWTGRVIREDKRGAIPAHIKPILLKLGIQQDNWVDSVKHFSHRFYRVVGSVEKIKQQCQHMQQKWLRGLTASQALYQQNP